MGKIRKELPGSLSEFACPRLDQLLNGIHLCSAYPYLEFDNLPETAYLDHIYNWCKGDFPDEKDVVQWILLLDFANLTRHGNAQFVECWHKAPYFIREKLLPMFKEIIYNGIIWSSEANELEDPDLFDNSRCRLVFKDDGYMLEELEGITYKDYPADNPRSKLPLSLIFERKLISKSVIDDTNKNHPVENSFVIKPQDVITEYKPFIPIEKTVVEDHFDAAPTVVIAKKSKPIDGGLIENIVKTEHDYFQIPQVDEQVKFRSSLPGEYDRVPLGSGITMGILGQGGFGTVVKIYNQFLDVFRAVKLLGIANVNISEEEAKKAKKSFLLEGRKCAKMQHPNIVAVHGFGEWNKYDYLEMEFIDGPVLPKIVNQFRQVPAHLVTSIGMQVADALLYAHNEEFTIEGKSLYGLIHRDLKPANIMVSNRGVTKLLDFGISKFATLNSMTNPGGFTGTLTYASPEQVEGLPIDIRTDIYSYGLVLYEMVTGRPAFVSKDLRSLLNDRMCNDFKPIEKYNIRIPNSLVQVIGKCLQADPDRRYESFVDIIDMLKDAHSQLTREYPDAILKDFMRNGACNYREEYIPGGKKTFWKKFWNWPGKN